MADADLKRTLGTLRYLQGLKQARGELQEQLPAAGAGSSQLRKPPAVSAGMRSHQQGNSSMQFPDAALQLEQAVEPASTGGPWAFLVVAQRAQHDGACAVPWAPKDCAPPHSGGHGCLQALKGAPSAMTRWGMSSTCCHVGTSCAADAASPWWTGHQTCLLR